MSRKNAVLTIWMSLFVGFVIVDWHFRDLVVAISDPWKKTSVEAISIFILFSQVILWSNYKANSRLVFDQRTISSLVVFALWSLLSGASVSFKSFDPYFFVIGIIVIAALGYQIRRKAVSVANGLIWVALFIAAYVMYVSYAR